MPGVLTLYETMRASEWFLFELFLRQFVFKTRSAVTGNVVLLYFLRFVILCFTKWSFQVNIASLLSEKSLLSTNMFEMKTMLSTIFYNESPQSCVVKIGLLLKKVVLINSICCYSDHSKARCCCHCCSQTLFCNVCCQGCFWPHEGLVAGIWR